MNSDGQPSYKMTVPDDYLSPYARSRSKRFFICMVVICVLFVFMAVPLYRGKFDDLLAWATGGEVCQLTPKRREIILQLMIWEMVFLAAAAATITAYYVRLSNG